MDEIFKKKNTIHLDCYDVVYSLKSGTKGRPPFPLPGLCPVWGQWTGSTDFIIRPKAKSSAAPTSSPASSSIKTGEKGLCRERVSEAAVSPQPRGGLHTQEMPASSDATPPPSHRTAGTWEPQAPRATHLSKAPSSSLLRQVEKGTADSG